MGAEHKRGQSFLARIVLPVSVAATLIFLPTAAPCEEMPSQENQPVRLFQDAAAKWTEWPPSEHFRITLEYRNYSYLKGESRGDSRDSINEGRLRIEYDNRFRDNMRAYINGLFQADDDNFTHGFIDDLEDDDIKRNYFNLSEAFVDVYFDQYDLRLGKQIINWGKADSVNPTDNICPSDYSNLLAEDDIGVFAINFNYYWNAWNLQLVGVPGFTPTRLPPRGTRFSLISPDPVFPVRDPELPSNTIDNAQFAARLKTTYRGWDASLSYYDGINDVPAPTLRFLPGPTIVPVYNRIRVIGGDFATTFDKWGLHGEAAQFLYDGDRQDSYFQYVIGVDYTKNNILFDHDLFMIVEYVGEDLTNRGTGLDVGTSLDKILTSAVAVNVTYKFTDYTKLEIKGAVDFDEGDDYYVQTQVVHEVTDNFEVTVGLDLLGGPEETFLGQFADNDRVFVELKYSF